MAESDHEQIAARLEHESDKLGKHADELREEIEHARGEWYRKRADSRIPGAPPLEEPDDAGAAQSGEAGRRAGGGPAGGQDPSEQQTPPG